jgi:hypothetical protein
VLSRVENYLRSGVRFVYLQTALQGDGIRDSGVVVSGIRDGRD